MMMSAGSKHGILGSGSGNPWGEIGRESLSKQRGDWGGYGGGRPSGGGDHPHPQRSPFLNPLPLSTPTTSSSSPPPHPLSNDSVFAAGLGGVLGEYSAAMNPQHGGDAFSSSSSAFNGSNQQSQRLSVALENGVNGGGGGGGGSGGNRNPRYKTEMCRNFKERSRCIYGDQCQFAHGRTDLRDVVRNTKYKTKLCQKYWAVGYCAYGPRCNFLHDEAVARQMAASEFPSHDYVKTKSTGSISPTPSSSDSLSNDRNYDLVIPNVMDQPDDVFISQWPKP